MERAPPIVQPRWRRSGASGARRVMHGAAHRFAAPGVALDRLAHICQIADDGMRLVLRPGVPWEVLLEV